MVDYEALAAATVQIRTDVSSGSGFFFLRDDLIVTNHHVIDGATTVSVVAEGSDSELGVKVLATSPSDEDDFAILRLLGKSDGAPTVLHPSDNPNAPRGTEVLIAGFPHGISDLLVQRGIISGPLEDYGFYLDVPVNEGNSGGPVVEAETGLLLGIVTQRRFLGGEELHDLDDEAQRLVASARATAGATMQFMGIDFGALVNTTGRSLGLLQRVIEANANTGLGIAYRITYARDEASRLGLG